MEQTSTTKDQIRQFILQSAQRKGVSTLADDESLSQNGVMDSLVIFRLVSFLEDTFNIRVADEEIVDENFQSINGIEKFVEAKLVKKAN
ncbi:MAG TPA: acyl carrier protein [Terriglobia bacterium]|nr:acyl carrier protein [Terriglobia bacterium]